MKQLAFLMAAVFFLIGSCKVEEKIVDGKTAFERKQYSKAAKLLTEEYNKSKMTTERGEKAFFIGESYRIINEVDKAKEWYLKSYDAAYGADALREYSPKPQNPGSLKNYIIILVITTDCNSFIKLH